MKTFTLRNTIGDRVLFIADDEDAGIIFVKYIYFNGDEDPADDMHIEKARRYYKLLLSKGFKPYKG